MNAETMISVILDNLVEGCLFASQKNQGVALA
jgi:hypothetical protein